MEVNIYADADEVELLLNGRSLGRKPCTEAQEYLAVFRFAYEPGTLEAVSYKNGVETGRDTLATASKTAALRLTADPAPPSPRTEKTSALCRFSALTPPETRFLPTSAKSRWSCWGGGHTGRAGHRRPQARPPAPLCRADLPAV